MSKNWSSTLRLPKSTFPVRPLPEFRKQYLERCTDDLYKWQASNRPASEPFILHDGPPYANGSLHVGHALNKVLKDMILRVKIQQGRRVSYMPGWDCHGLPIEMKAVGDSGHKTMTLVAIREAARKLASSAVLDQMESFRSYAVMGDWDKRWTTMDQDYEIRQLNLFQKLVHRGLIYRKCKPVYWSPSSGTALAEAELEYNENHISRAAYVAFPIVGDPLSITKPGEKLYAIIWTTTPWTLPANRAIAIHDDIVYTIIRNQSELFIVARDLVDRVIDACFSTIKDGVVLRRDTVETVVDSIKGMELKHLTYINELRYESSQHQPVIHGDFVTADSGTGVVHCAPGHGFDDYQVCTRLGIPVDSPVDENGFLTDEAYPHEPARLTGQHVLKGAGKAVLSIIDNRVLSVGKYKHKYPYDWRTKQPVIIRATEQWFADVASIKTAALDSLKGVKFFPETGRNRLESFVKGRSEWCISRQRAWGLPIPALYRMDGSAVVTEESVAHIISVVKERGTDAWWSDAPDDKAWIAPGLRDEDLKRGTDTMDVWFDSGSSWSMLDKRADVYLEGSDQHRGWFQSSLLTHVAATADTEDDGDTSTTNTTGEQQQKQVAQAPFKTVITHGFTLDQKGKKMSKSIGNIISPTQVMDGSLLPPVKTKGKNKAKPKPNTPPDDINNNKDPKAPPPAPRYDALGPDALRLWVASSEYTKDVSLGKQVLEAVQTSLLRYRYILRMLTGSMHASARSAPLTPVDHIALFHLQQASAEVSKAYGAHEFYRGVTAINRWVANDLSAFYLEASKDRLYCGDGGGVVEVLFLGFCRMLAPVTPVLVEEAWENRPQWLKDDRALQHPLHQLAGSPLYPSPGGSEPHTTVTIPESPFFKGEKFPATVSILMTIHSAAKSAIEHARNNKLIGSSLQASLRISTISAELLELLKPMCEDESLLTMFVVSGVSVVPSRSEAPVTESEGGEEEKMNLQIPFTTPKGSGTVMVVRPEGKKCGRCWRYKSVEEDGLCGRCEEVVAGQEVGT